MKKIPLDLVKDYCATPQHSMSKSDGWQLHSCNLEGHRPYFRLLLEESWYASLELSLCCDEILRMKVRPL